MTTAEPERLVYTDRPFGARYSSIIFAMSNPLIPILIAAALVSLGGCGSLPTNTPPSDSAKSQTPPPPGPLPFKKTAKPPKELSGDLLYEYLAGELGARRGGDQATIEHLLTAARQAKDPVAAAQAAQLALRLKDLEKAQEAAELWVKLAPNSLPARELSVLLALRRGDRAEALAQAEALLKITEAIHKDGFLELAAVLAAEKLDGKLALMETLARRHQRDPRAHYALALVATQRKRYDQAFKALDRASELKPDWDKPYLLRTQILDLQGDKAGAERVLARAAREHPSPLLYKALGRRQMQHKRYEEALESFRKAVALNPEDQEALSTVGVLAIQTKHWKLARRTLERLAKIGSPERRNEARYFLGQIEELQDRPEKAIEHYQQVTGGRFLGDARLRQAILLGKQGKFEEAARLFREVRLTNPLQAVPTFITEAQLYKEQGQPEKAMAIYNEALAANPGDLDLLYARGLLAADMGDIEQAEKDFRAVLEKKPDDADTLNALGYTLADNNIRLQEAYEYIRKAYEKEPESTAIQDSMGWILYRLGRLEEALKYLRKAAAEMDDGEIAAHLGEVLWMLGRKEEARKVWAEARKRDPDNPKLKATIERFK